jgi:hypothetical protein
MKKLLLAPLLSLAACAGNGDHVADPGERVVYQTVYKAVREPCPVKEPPRPAKLVRPLPVDPASLATLLIAKLLEWDGPGKYADQVHDGFAICTRPVPPSAPAEPHP